ncbi:hypothetical protein M427DRAFT_155447 [Gonapodya prolifera JEL478]|uniref:SnoaL-like domain-containing protein n=1 Tax=Gonapodya prolifera (strain JEL478) TaxID=1344416 RepID=A0A139AET6_GONPJ|nr:hypothetical protein M427DRAFT_155447 [Gonapodya prolifera JEL478]|eukprot:KXS15268.1 hypothetical protein M427DRAFT_155447 [Gonapodya prolifera JEL478]
MDANHTPRSGDVSVASRTQSGAPPPTNTFPTRRPSMTGHPNPEVERTVRDWFMQFITLDPELKYMSGYADGAVVRFVARPGSTAMKFPKGVAFWYAMGTLANTGFKDFRLEPRSELAIASREYTAMAMYRMTVTNYHGTTWAADSLMRLKYDETGKIVDHAFFPGDVDTLNRMLDECLTLGEVREALKAVGVGKAFGIY